MIFHKYRYINHFKKFSAVLNKNIWTNSPRYPIRKPVYCSTVVYRELSENDRIVKANSEDNNYQNQKCQYLRILINIYKKTSN